MKVYKLKCAYCDHLNEVNSEYLTFCSNCNKKLKNSFQEWIRVNPGKSFEDYKLSECIDEQKQLEKIREFKTRNKKWNFKLLIFLIIFGVFFAGGFTLYHFKKDDLLNYFTSFSNTSDDILNREWEKKAYYDLHFYIETPYKPDTISVPYPEQVKALILSTAAYAIDENAGAFRVLLNYVEYKPNIPLSFEDAIQGSINSIENEPGITDLSPTVTPYALQGNQASIVSGTLKKYGIRFNFKMLVFAGEHQLSQIVVEYHVNDENAEKAAERIFNSLKLL